MRLHVRVHVTWALIKFLKLSLKCTLQIMLIRKDLKTFCIIVS